MIKTKKKCSAYVYIIMLVHDECCLLFVLLSYKQAVRTRSAYCLVFHHLETTYWYRMYNINTGDATINSILLL